LGSLGRMESGHRAQGVCCLIRDNQKDELPRSLGLFRAQPQ
jgi:hypothetical protein